MRRNLKNILSLLALLLTTSYVSNAQSQQNDSTLYLPQGWSMFGYVSTEQIDVLSAFTEIATEIEIVKDGLGLAYIPDWGFNAIGDFQFARGYQVKMINEVEGFQFSSVISNPLNTDGSIASLEASLITLQEEMMIANELEMYNHMYQDDQISVLQNDMMMNHINQGTQIASLQADLNAALNMIQALQDQLLNVAEPDGDYSPGGGAN